MNWRQIWSLATPAERVEITVLILDRLESYKRFIPHPAPLGFAFVASMATFGLLLVLPSRPISMIIALGAGISFALITYDMRRRLCGDRLLS